MRPGTLDRLRALDDLEQVAQLVGALAGGPYSVSPVIRDDLAEAHRLLRRALAVLHAYEKTAD